MFLQFLNNKEFLPDSFTAYKTKIGLGSRDASLLSENHDIVLNFPYKDCILEGGQTKEDVKRDEIFETSLEILSTIQRTKNIPMNDKEFTENLVEAVQRMSDKNEHFDFSEMLEGTYASLTSAPTLKDFKIVDYYGQNPENSYAANLNAKMKNGDFEHLKQKTTTKLNTLSKEKSMSR